MGNSSSETFVQITRRLNDFVKCSTIRADSSDPKRNTAVIEITLEGTACLAGTNRLQYANPDLDLDKDIQFGGQCAA